MATGHDVRHGTARRAGERGKISPMGPSASRIGLADRAAWIADHIASRGTALGGV
jgi:hypothetical protein